MDRVENNLTNDLDNNLLASDAYSGINSYSNIVKRQFTMQSPSGQLTPEPEPSPRTVGNTSTGGNGSEGGNIGETIPRTGGDTSPDATTQPVGEAIPLEEDDFIPPMGGGGGGMMPPAEEEAPVMAKMDAKKILGLEPKIFYGLLAVAGVAGYFYFRKKIKIINK